MLRNCGTCPTPGPTPLPRGGRTRSAKPTVLTRWSREPSWRQKDVITSSGSSEKTKLGARGRRLYCSTICPTASPYTEKSGPTAPNGPGGQLESQG